MIEPTGDLPEEWIFDIDTPAPLLLLICWASWSCCEPKKRC
jgi:hypothetical protein